MAQPIQSNGDPQLADTETGSRVDHGQLFTTIHDLSRLISVYFDAKMARHQLTHSQWWALMYISEHEGATQIELAAYMQMGRASAGKLFERLEAKNWIERRPDDKDGRVRRIFLKQDAIGILEIMRDEGTNLFTDFLKGIGPEEEAAVLAGLLKIRANAEGR
ncbi:MarR family winged helix-turn-helix transcriptional regulator [Devosia sediminis]|uniref:MarR family transcriptional regulator n=1 Tax=Devosia sediminis TaxID=2798801 RepID=A0A934IWS8_9HYPH|nr:MarR family transcriptional regulator [Devosia sediminis]MBJ3785797.1 MarR family transcriptional regulator [Devosia sediminis]